MYKYLTGAVQKLFLEGHELFAVDDKEVGDTQVQSHVHDELEHCKNLLLCLHHHKAGLLLGRFLERKGGDKSNYTGMICFMCIHFQAMQ